MHDRPLDGVDEILQADEFGGDFPPGIGIENAARDELTPFIDKVVAQPLQRSDMFLPHCQFSLCIRRVGHWTSVRLGY
ncbi:MAG: hypothetical protein KGJ00_20790 [Bradyrhizobium sp.]|nr:hypothetical protein [Bradyrhizobium sp.]